MSRRVVVHHYPNCDLCDSVGHVNEARYDGKTKMGTWANMCQKHFDSYGVGLGTGKGQELIVE